jgi:hypothetical protein
VSSQSGCKYSQEEDNQNEDHKRTPNENIEPMYLQLITEGELGEGTTVHIETTIL